MENLHTWLPFSVPWRGFWKPWEGFATSWGMKLNCSYNAWNWNSMFPNVSGWIPHLGSFRTSLHLTTSPAHCLAGVLRSLPYATPLLEINLTYWLVSFYGYSHQPSLTWNILDLVPPLMRATSYGTLYQSRLIRSAWAVPRYQPCLSAEHTDLRLPRDAVPESKFFLIHRFYCKGQLRLWIQLLYPSCNLGSLVVQHTCIEELLQEIDCVNKLNKTLM